MAEDSVKLQDIIDSLRQEQQEDQGVIQCWQRRCSEAESLIIEAYKVLSGYEHEPSLSEAQALLLTAAHNARKNTLKLHGVK